MEESFAQRRIGEYLGALGGEQAAPGGGSAAGLVAALSACLAEMMASLTRVRSARLETARQDLMRLRARALDCGRNDELSYGAYIAALQLPQSTPEEKSSRRSQMNAAMEQAAHVPLELGETAAEILEKLESVILDGNRTVLGDAEAAMVLARATYEICEINIRANLSYIRDEQVAERITTRLEQLRQRIEHLIEVRQHDIRIRGTRESKS